jgi:hypothetical protein
VFLVKENKMAIISTKANEDIDWRGWLQEKSENIVSAASSLAQLLNEMEIFSDMDEHQKEHILLLMHTILNDGTKIMEFGHEVRGEWTTTLASSILREGSGKYEEYRDS